MPSTFRGIGSRRSSRAWRAAASATSHPAQIAHERDDRVKRGWPARSTASWSMRRAAARAPCAGIPTSSGASRPRRVAGLAPTQRTILAAAARLVKPGGRLVYATCSVLDPENQAVAAEFDADQAPPSFACPRSRPCSAPRSPNAETLVVGNELQLWTHRHGTDGFFAAIWERVRTITPYCLRRDIRRFLRVSPRTGRLEWHVFCVTSGEGPWMDVLTSVTNALVEWLGHGFSGFSAWEIVAYTLVTTHITIAAVTIFLHRAQAHRALDLHAIPAHFLPLLALARLGHGDQGMGRHPPQAPRPLRDRGRSAQPADARHQDRPAAGQRALPDRGQEPANPCQVRPRHAR